MKDERRVKKWKVKLFFEESETVWWPDLTDPDPHPTFSLRQIYARTACAANYTERGISIQSWNQLDQDQDTPRCWCGWSTGLCSNCKVNDVEVIDAFTCLGVKDSNTGSSEPETFVGG